MFRARIRRHPLPYDPSAGRAARAALTPPPEVAPLIEGAAGCSPFLARLVGDEAEWLRALWDAEPEAALDALIAGIAGIEGDPKGPLRRAKRRAALLVGLSELGGVWEVMEATAAWTRFADACVAAAFRWGLVRHGRPPVEGDGGLVVFAMGKMGAGELNYSSDIDLVLLFDETRYETGDYAEARARLLKAARLAAATLSDVTAEGYVFRTDLRLRPDPSSTPIVLSFEAAERYYEALGRTWERAAWIKARPCAGAVAAGEGFLRRLVPFVWRRHLDFAAVQDAHEMRLRIRDHKGFHAAWDVPGHDVKLGPGGIREIEFLAQTNQLVLGGRDPALRMRATLPALDALVGAGRLGGDDRDVLATAYRRLRAVEHRLQMVQDAQTHRVPRDADGLDRLARFMGQDDTGAFVDGLRETLRAVEAIADPAFRPCAPAAVPDPWPEARAVTDRWVTYPAARSERARAILDRLRPGLLSELGRAAHPDEALAAFDAFLRGLPAGVQVLSLFEANPRLVGLLADICATSPDLARHLSRNAGVLDAVIDGSFFADLPVAPDPPETPGDFEAALDTLRRWHREAHFRIGVHLLRGLIEPRQAGDRYAALADAALRGAWSVAMAETARRQAPPEGLRVMALGMGSLGAGRLTARSDLDLVVLHDGGGAEAGQWAARFTRVLISVLTVPTAEGRLYEVDMRLRPSGQSGPVATSLGAFRAYQSSEAWVWEHLALTRARPVAGDAGLCDEVEALRRALIRDSRFDRGQVLSELSEMLGRLRRAKTPGALKSGPGRMQEIELAAQANALLARAPIRDIAGQLACDGWLSKDDRDALARAHALLARLQQAARLLGGADAIEAEGTGGAAFLAERAGVADLAEAVRAAEDAAGAARIVIDGALDRAGTPV